MHLNYQEPFITVIVTEMTAFGDGNLDNVIGVKWNHRKTLSRPCVRWMRLPASQNVPQRRREEEEEDGVFHYCGYCK